MPTRRKSFRSLSRRIYSRRLLLVGGLLTASVLTLNSQSVAQSPRERARLSASGVDAESANLVTDGARMKVRAQHFVERHNQLAQRNDLDSIMGLYAERVKYYDRGVVPRSAVREDKAAYLKRWPQRRYQIIGDLTTTVRNAKPAQQVIVTYESTYDVRGFQRTANGRAKTIFTLQPTTDSRDFKITGEQSRVLPNAEDLEADAEEFEIPPAVTAKAVAQTATHSKLGRFLLVDAATNEVVRELAPTERISRRVLPEKMSIAFEPAQKYSGTVVFDVNGHKRFRIESAPPYALAGDTGGDYKPWTPRMGENNIQVSLSGSSEGSAALQLVVIEREERKEAERQQGESESLAGQEIAAMPQEDFTDGASTAEAHTEPPPQEARSALKFPRDVSASGTTSDAEVAVLEAPVIEATVMEAPVMEVLAPEEQAIEYQTTEEATDKQTFDEQATDQSQIAAATTRGRAAITRRTVADSDSEARLFDLVATFGSAKGTCLATRTKWEVDFVCSHSLANPATATLRRSADASAPVLCDLGAASDPIVTTCYLSVDDLEHYRSGNAVVIVTNVESEETLIGMVRP